MFKRIIKISSSDLNFDPIQKRHTVSRRVVFPPHHHSNSMTVVDRWPSSPSAIHLIPQYSKIITIRYVVSPE